MSEGGKAGKEEIEKMEANYIPCKILSIIKYNSLILHPLNFTLKKAYKHVDSQWPQIDLLCPVGPKVDQAALMIGLHRNPCP